MTAREDGKSRQEDMGALKNEISIPVGAIVERRRVDHPWADWSWRPVAAVVEPPALEDWHVMVSEGDTTRYHAGTTLVTLHRKLVEAYRINLALDVPSLWIMLDAADPSAAMPWQLSQITVSPYDAQDLADSGEGILEQVPMPEDLLALLVEFVRHHPAPEEFRKRRRDEVKLEDLQFGKEPIFAQSAQHQAARSKSGRLPGHAGSRVSSDDEGCNG
ncbi:DUF3305 domain-containing protein [Breoghania sp.]|uniref:DUF3305 domain-containing protein n=1 Tax=Breoghania sp. TaxID=2065378 RepID=UPI0029CA3673|nr:DUF3305 domain-containing protein [Breoghania sp.]